MTRIYKDKRNGRGEVNGDQLILILFCEGGAKKNMNEECEITRISLSKFDSQSTESPYWNDDKKEKDEAKSKIDELSEAFRSVITLVGEDPDREGLRATPLRAAKAFCYFTKGYEETVAGNYYESIAFTLQENSHYKKIIFICLL